ncbi:hypothetical protein EV361DRAFT_985189, partial [Lentinula raphanica]
RDPPESPPDDGSPEKLKTFLVSLPLVFIDCLNYFTDQRKINSSLSYLTGAACEWFEPDILDLNLEALPAWTMLYAALVQELQENFGLVNLKINLDKLGTLWMRNNDKVGAYNIKFNTLAAASSWDINAL